MVRYDATRRVSKRIPWAEIGRRPGDVGGTALLGAPREGDDAVEARVGFDVQVRRRVRDLEEDREFAEVE